MLCLEYNPKDPHLLVGGCYNGQLALFDTRKGAQPLEVTPVEISHKDPVHKLIFPSSKTGEGSPPLALAKSPLTEIRLLISKQKQPVGCVSQQGFTEGGGAWDFLPPLPPPLEF